MRQLSADSFSTETLYRLSRNTSGGLGEQEMPREYEPQVSVSTAFSSSPKLSRVFLLDKNTENMFSFSFRKHYDEKRAEDLFTLIIKM